MKCVKFCTFNRAPYIQDDGGKARTSPHLGKGATCSVLKKSFGFGTKTESFFEMSRRYPGVRTIKANELYEINFYPSGGGKRRQFRVTAASEREAFLLRAEYIVRQGKDVPVENGLSFNEIKERLKLKCQSDGNCEKTIVNLLSKFINLFETFMPQYYPEFKDISKLTSVIVERYKQFVVIDQKRPYGWRDELTKLKSIFRKLIDIGVCRKEIYSDVLGQFKKPKRRLKIYQDVTKTQMQQLLIFIKEDHPAFYGPTYMIMRLGWRRGQVLSLKRKNIRLNGFRPAEIVCEPQDTKNKEPFILRDVDDELAKVIQRYLYDGQETDWLFPNKKGKRIHANNFTAYISKTSQKVLGFHLFPHAFRHIFCTTRLKEGAIDRDIMAITGHKDAESFRMYVHATSEGTKQVLNRSRIF